MWILDDSGGMTWIADDANQFPPNSNYCGGYCGWGGSYPCPCTRRMEAQQQPRGCICPPGSEKTCQGIGCPRRGFNIFTTTITV